jgi:hypothetical protein
VSANAAPSARNARKKTSDKATGARAAKHSKAVIEEPAAPSDAAPAVVAPVFAEPVAAVPVPVEVPVVEELVAVAAPKVVTQEEIAKLAYCYWADRGCQGGSPEEDWARAEQTLLAAVA